MAIRLGKATPCAGASFTSCVKDAPAHLALLLVAMVCFVFSASSAQAAINKPPNNLGLVGYWSMDDCRSTRATDLSGQGNHGTLSGFAYTGTSSNWLTGANAKRGCALNFDGTDDYVSTPSSPVLVTNTGSYALWFKAGTQLGANRRLIESGIADTNNRMGIHMSNATTDGAGGYIYAYGMRDAGGLIFALESTTGTYNDSRWHHVLSTWDSSNAYLYIDGVLADTYTGNSVMTIPSPTAVYIGSYTTGAFNFNGSLDEVRIYNRALGATEVRSLYNSGVAKVSGASTEGVADGLVGHWKLDDRTGTRALDSSRYANHGTLTNFALSGATSNWAFGYRAGALTFDGTNDYVTVTDAAPLQMTGDMSISLWAYPNTSSQTSILVDKGSSWTNNITYGIGLSSGVWRWLHGNSYQASSGVTASVGAWNHVVGVRTTSNTTITWYVNGALVTGASYTTAPVTNSITLGIGDEGGATHPSAPFNGSIDDVRIYNRALTEEQIKTLYTLGTTKPALVNVASNRLTTGTNLASGLVGHWTFDGRYLTTATARDTSGQANHGTLTNGPVPTQGKLGQALSFDGVNDYVVTGDYATSNSSPMTWSVWVNPTATSNNTNGIIGYSTTSPERIALVSGHSGANTDKWAIYTPGSGYIFGSTHGLNQWYHLVMVFDGTNVSLYVNGVLDISPTAASYTAGTIPFAFGRFYYNLNGYYFPGSLDDVRIYNRALTAAEVQQLYNLGR